MDASWESVEVLEEREDAYAICNSASLSDMKVSEKMTSNCRKLVNALVSCDRELTWGYASRSSLTLNIWGLPYAALAAASHISLRFMVPVHCTRVVIERLKVALTALAGLIAF